MREIKRRYLYAVIFAAALLEITVLRRIRFFGAQPDLLLTCVVFFSTVFDRELSLEAAVLSGFARDTFVSGIFGLNTALFALLALSINFYKDKVYKDFFLTQVFLMLLAGGFFYLGFFFLKLVLSGAAHGASGSNISRVILPAALYTALVSPLVFFTMGKIFRVKQCE